MGPHVLKLDFSGGSTMFVRMRWFVSALTVVFCAAGCGEDKATESTDAEGTAPAAKGDSPTAEATADDAAAAADDQPTTSAANKPPAIPTPDVPIALLTKNLAPLGWTSPKPASEAGGTKSVGFVKGNRSLSTNVRAGSGQKGSSITLMHLAYAG
jgi:hypothetical protein